MKFILIGLVLRLFIAIWNGFYGPSIGADGDALLFHEIGVEFSRFGLFDAKYSIGWIYSIFLGAIYFLTIDSIFIGSLVSCMAWFVSAIFLDKTIKLLGVNKKQRDMALLVYAIIPSSILFTSVTLREVYQLLFINLLIYGSLKILLTQKLKSWFIILISGLGMGALHFGLVLYAILGALTTFYFTSIRGGRIFSLELIIFYMPLVIILGVAGNYLFVELVPFDFSDGIAAAVQGYQAGHNEARAMYTLKPEIDGLFGLLLFMPVSLGQYMLEPMPWKIETLLDMALFIENIFRLLLIFIAIRSIFKVNKEIKPAFIFLVLMFFALELMWALGTVNWGSAVRHHIPGMGLLIIIGICFNDTSLHSISRTPTLRRIKKI